MENSEEPVAAASKVTENLYWTLFRLGFGDNFHSFLEWCGVLREYLNMVQAAGVDPRTLNTHTQVQVTIPQHQLDYMAEKLNCILAPFLRASIPGGRVRFCRILLGISEKEALANLRKALLEEDD